MKNLNASHESIAASLTFRAPRNVGIVDTFTALHITDADDNIVPTICDKVSDADDAKTLKLALQMMVANN